MNGLSAGLLNLIKVEILEEIKNDGNEVEPIQILQKNGN